MPEEHRSKRILSPLRILNVDQAYFPFQDRGGPVFKVRSLASGLAKRGHHVAVLTADLGIAKLNGSHTEIVRSKRGWTALVTTSKRPTFPRLGIAECRPQRVENVR